MSESSYSLGFWFLHDVSVSCIPENWMCGNYIFVGTIAVAQLHVGLLLSHHTHTCQVSVLDPGWFAAPSVIMPLPGIVRLCGGQRISWSGCTMRLLAGWLL